MEHVLENSHLISIPSHKFSARQARIAEHGSGNNNIFRSFLYFFTKYKYIAHIKLCLSQNHINKIEDL